MQDYTNATTMTEPLRDYMTGNATPAIRDREELRVAPPIPTGEKPIAEMLNDALQIMSEAEKTLGTILRNMQKDEPGPPPDEEPKNLQHEDRRAVHIAAVIMQAAGLCRYDDVARCRRGWTAEDDDCVAGSEKWLLAKARREIRKEKTE